MVVKAPNGLGAAGRRLWRDVTGGYELRVDELVLLEKTCRTADDAARLEKALAVAPLEVTGSAGQLRIHPLFAECRAARALMASLLRQLSLPESSQGREWVPGLGDTTTLARKAVLARKAARARWDSPRGA